MIVVHGNFLINNNACLEERINRVTVCTKVCMHSRASETEISYCSTSCPLLITASQIGAYSWSQLLPANVVAIAMCGCMPIIYAGPKTP